MHYFILALIPASLPLEQATQSLGGTQGPDLTSYFQVCGLLLAVIALVAFGMRKLIAGSFKLRASQRSLQVIDVLNLGGRRKLAVVRCYDRTFVLGLGEKEIAPIAELDPVIGSEQKTAAPRKSDDEAFAHALERIQESMPEDELMSKLLEAQDRVSPSLAKKMVRPGPVAAEQPGTAQAAAGQRPVAQFQAPQTAQAAQRPAAPAPASAKTRVVKKRVRRKVVKRPVEGESPRRLEAQAVASAALDMAAAQRQAKAQVGTTVQVVERPTQTAQPAPATQKPAQVEPPILRMEGILG